jgi:glycosyltransferase involved in cell wall biosynthesis
MRVVLANKFLYPRGGAERAVLTLGAELARRGHRVHYFGMQHPENAVGGDDVELVRWRDYRQAGAARWRDAAAMLYSPSARRSFGRLLDRVRPDVVHVHNIYHQITPSILDAARQRGVPVVMTLHDYKLVCPRYDMLRHGKPCDACIEEGPSACVRYRCAGGSWGASLLLACESALHRARGSYDAVRLFLVPSLFLAGVLLRAGFARERLRHVPNFATAVASEPGVPEPGRFLYAGRLSPEKGVETLARAASRLRRGELVLCGTGPLEPALRALASAAPPGRIRLLGHLPAVELWRETARSSFVVAPSEWYENAPFAVLEAMALGRAVVASRLGGLPELVREEETGDLVPPGDEAAWTQALERGIESPERMRRMGDRARLRARDDFALDRHVDRVLHAYAEAQS